MEDRDDRVPEFYIPPSYLAIIVTVAFTILSGIQYFNFRMETVTVNQAEIRGILTALKEQVIKECK
jgi:hypothetical protein